LGGCAVSSCCRVAAAAGSPLLGPAPNAAPPSSASPPPAKAAKGPAALHCSGASCATLWRHAQPQRQGAAVRLALTARLVHWEQFASAGQALAAAMRKLNRLYPTTQKGSQAALDEPTPCPSGRRALSKRRHVKSMAPTTASGGHARRPLIACGPPTSSRTASPSPDARGAARSCASSPALHSSNQGCASSPPLSPVALAPPAPPPPPPPSLPPPRRAAPGAPGSPGAGADPNPAAGGSGVPSAASESRTYSSSSEPNEPREEPRSESPASQPHGGSAGSWLATRANAPGGTPPPDVTCAPATP